MDVTWGWIGNQHGTHVVLVAYLRSTTSITFLLALDYMFEMQFLYVTDSFHCAFQNLEEYEMCESTRSSRSTVFEILRQKWRPISCKSPALDFFKVSLLQSWAQVLSYIVVWEQSFRAIRLALFFFSGLKDGSLTPPAMEDAPSNSPSLARQ